MWTSSVATEFVLNMQVKTHSNCTRCFEEGKQLFNSLKSYLLKLPSFCSNHHIRKNKITYFWPPSRSTKLYKKAIEERIFNLPFSSLLKLDFTGRSLERTILWNINWIKYSLRRALFILSNFNTPATISFTFLKFCCKRSSETSDYVN